MNWDSFISIGVFCMVLGGVNMITNDPIPPTTLFFCGVGIFVVGLILMLAKSMALKRNLKPSSQVNPYGGY